MTERTARVAGIDTREAWSRPTVRHAARAAAFVAAPGWIAAFAVPFYWRRWLDMPGWLTPWPSAALVVAAFVAGAIAWRRGAPTGTIRALPLGSDSVVTLGVAAALATTPRYPALLAYMLPLAPILAGWAVGRAARMAADASPAYARAAAGGLVLIGAFSGLAGAAHLALVLRGSGIQRSATWALVYLSAALVSFARAGRAARGDRADVSPVVDARTRADANEGAHALSIERVSVAFGANQVLRDATLIANAGELVALVGQNGSGKSTLLRVAAGLQAADAGQVLLVGEDISQLIVEERAAAGIAFVSGARPIFPDLTVVENLRVAAFRTHLTARAFRAATDAVFDVVPALAQRRDTKAGVLSGGEQRLLALAQTLYRTPAVLLADELSLGLDHGAREAVLTALRTFADQGMCVIVVDHDLQTLLSFADSAALLTDGTIRRFDPAGRILRERRDLLPATFLAGVSR